MDIDILLSTYNGEQYLRNQIESIINQTYKNWRLLIRDDGSQDKTIEILEYYLRKHKDKIVLIEDGQKHLGASKSFFRLLGYSDAKYIMFCDQDDVWLPYKIEKTYNKMKELEKKHNDKPLLVYSDLKVVDKDLNLIAPSFWKYQHIDPKRNKLNHLLVQNVITGCTMMINNKLKDMLITMPDDEIMHDWWLGLVGASFGELDFIKEPLVLYRQHGKNDTGAQKYGLMVYLNLILRGDLSKFFSSNKRLIKQAKNFYKIYYNLLDKSQKDIVYNFMSLCEKNPSNRLITMIKCRYFKYGFLRNIGFIISCLLMPKEDL